MEGFGGVLPRRELPTVLRSYELGLMVLFLVSTLAAVISIATSSLGVRLVATPCGTLCLVLLVLSWRNRIG